MAALEGIDHSVLNISGRVRVDQATNAALSQRIEATVTVTGNHRQSRSRSLKKHNAETLTRARHRENVGKGIVIAKRGVGHVTGEYDPFGDPRFPRQALQARPVVA